MTEGINNDSIHKKIRLGAKETPYCPHDLGWQVLVGRGMCPPLVQAQSGQCGNIHLHSKDMLLWQERQHLVGCAVCFISDMNQRHVVLVWRHTQVGNAWSPAGALLAAVSLEDTIEPLAYTALEDNLVLALPPAWM